MKPTQLPSGAWRCQVYLGKDSNGKKQFISVTKPDKNDCLIEAARIAKHHHETVRDSSKLTLQEAINEYIQMKDGILSPSTIRSYESMERCHLQSLMQTQLCKLNRNIIQKALNEESKRFAPKTVINVYRLLTAVLNQFNAIDFEVSIKQPEDREVNTLNEEQMITLITALQGDRSEVPLLIAMFLGLHRSEIMALEHSDFDPDTNIITIDKAKVPDRNGMFVIKEPKSKKSRRKLSVPPYLAEKLKACVQKQEPFYNVAPERPYKRLQQLCEKYKLPKMSMHDLRHQNASIMLSLNIPDKYAMERGGWSSDRTMKRVYQHTMDQQRLETENIMSNYFESLTRKLP